MNRYRLENLQKVTESIRKGKRIILFPPGMFSLVSLVLILIITTVLAVSSIINLFFSEHGFETTAILQFSGLGIAFVFAIFPNLMILSGKKKFSVLCFYYSIALLVVSSVILLVGLTGLFNLNNAFMPLLSSIGLSIISIFVYRSASYLLIKEFFYLLKNPEAN